MNRILISITDVREYRQLGKQLNDDNFEGRSREVQDNSLTDLLGKPLTYDFNDYLENDWITQAGTFTRDSDYQFTVTGLDLSGWVDYALRINNTGTDETFVIVKTAVYGGSNTVVTVEGYILPTTIDDLEYKTDNTYIKLLNGTDYVQDSKTIQFKGLRPFIIWKFLAIFLSDANVKHSDTGNFSISSTNFQRPSGSEINAARSTYLENSAREENDIIAYLDTESSDYELWEAKNGRNIVDFDFMVI